MRLCCRPHVVLGLRPSRERPSSLAIHIGPHTACVREYIPLRTVVSSAVLFVDEQKYPRILCVLQFTKSCTPFCKDCSMPHVRRTRYRRIAPTDFVNDMVSKDIAGLEAHGRSRTKMTRSKSANIFGGICGILRCLTGSRTANKA